MQSKAQSLAAPAGEELQPPDVRQWLRHRVPEFGPAAVTIAG